MLAAVNLDISWQDLLLMLDQILDSTFNLGLETPFILLILVAIEAVLSADNAIALAGIAKGLEDSSLQRQALNYGLVIAYVLRIILIVTATWVVHFWQFQLVGALYLLWLVWNYFTSKKGEDGEPVVPRFASLWQTIPMIALTDMAFSLDSVTTAIAISQKTWLIIAGGTIGVIALRFLAGLFITWLDEFVHLGDAGYITVGLVGLRLLLTAVYPDLVPPEWLIIICIVGIFTWGFSQRTIEKSSTESKVEE